MAALGTSKTVEAVVDTKSVTITTLDETDPSTLVIPIHQFEGVVVHIQGADEPGAVVARLILKHSDPQLSLLLSETDKPELLAQSWPAWAEALGLPMLVWELGGMIKPIEAYSARPSCAPHPRRKLPLLTGRRPRFLVRRPVGRSAADATVYQGEREIIAPH
ncbi:MAG: hypothetical protein HWE23_08175 [Rhodobacteraceae bacterium]|nr:hypothetical protein [Paracoccaceae bacterium]